MFQLHDERIMKSEVVLDLHRPTNSMLKSHNIPFSRTDSLDNFDFAIFSYQFLVHPTVAHQLCPRSLTNSPAAGNILTYASHCYHTTIINSG